MESTCGTTLQNIVHRGLIPRKVSINDKDHYKTVTKEQPTWSHLLVITFL